MKKPSAAVIENIRCEVVRVNAEKRTQVKVSSMATKSGDDTTRKFTAQDMVSFADFVMDEVVGVGVSKSSAGNMLSKWLKAAGDRG